MVKHRESISRLGQRLSELVIEGGADTGTGRRLAEQLLALCKQGGVYRKQYGSHEERVLHRHLNLYRNKLEKAKTEPERLRWKAKVIEQEAKIRAHARGDGVTDDLDLDGL